MAQAPLLSSLFRDRSAFNRSSSLLNKALGSAGEDKTRTRSQSIFSNQHNKNSNLHNNYRPLIRLAHIFATKVKKHNYFLFCRLETNLKKCRERQTQKQEQPKNKQNFPHQGIEKLNEFFMLKDLKVNLQSQFNKIKAISKKKLKIITFTQTLMKKCCLLKKFSFQALKQNEKISLKVDIFASVLKSRLNSVYQSGFSIMKMLDLNNKPTSEKINQKLYLGGDSFSPIQQESSGLISDEGFDSIKLQTEIKESSTSTLLLTATKCLQFSETPFKKEFSKQKKFQSDIFDSQSEERERKSSQKQNKKSMIMIKKQTKIKSPHQKISNTKAISIQIPQLEKQQRNQIEIPQNTNQKQTMMIKHNHLYHEMLSEQIPDIHDSLGVFAIQGLPSEKDVQSMNTFRTMEQQKELEKLTSPSQRRKTTNITETNQNGDLQKSEKKSTVIELRKKMSTSYVNQKKKSTYSPLGKIEEMMVDIQKIRSKQKNHGANYKQCKFSIVLPNKTSEFSVKNSASKGSNKKSVQYRSEKRQKISQNKLHHFKTKEFDWQKQNIQMRRAQKGKSQLYEQKQTLLKQKMQKKKANSILDQTIVTTARKMKKEIENIINQRKSRTSLGCLKIVRDKN